jgi:hypothetical protein
MRKSILWPQKLLGGIRRMGQCKRPYGPQHTLHSPFALQRKDMPNRRLPRNGETKWQNGLHGREYYLYAPSPHRRYFDAHRNLKKALSAVITQILERPTPTQSQGNLYRHREINNRSTTTTVTRSPGSVQQDQTRNTIRAQRSHGYKTISASSRRMDTTTRLTRQIDTTARYESRSSA